MVNRRANVSILQIQDIFKKDIKRPINGVVKADQLNESVVWQELDEYVPTKELNQHFRKFLSAYLAVIDAPNNTAITDRMGVWVSGFFGSGKSHFIKILSYLLENRKAVNPENNTEKQAISFFEDKIKDPMLIGDLKRMAAIDADVFLFNIDSRADATDGRTTILSVFWRIFNQSQGFCGQSLHLAEIERYLAKKGKFEAFKNQFEKIYGSKWETERDAYTLLQDEIVSALSVVLDKSEQAAREWFEKIEQEFNLTVENFARRVKEYLDTKSGNHRIIYLVDEIGQFIGNNSPLMLNLQTIVEDLGRICQGRVWVVVTSQEDIDAVIGDIKASKANDFSKIQGRFNTRLSLSSANTDEVIQIRLLEKTKQAKGELGALFDEKGDILKNQLSFTYDSSTLKNYADNSDFIANYPFVPYHFQLVQKIFESIRKAGATGLHLARGERSMLDAFQSAAVNLADSGIGTLVPLYEFYPCIENFLDTSVKRSIEQAKTNTGLQMPFDVHLLQVLFLIRYVNLIKPNVDNLVTLLIDQADADRIELKRGIEEGLKRLEKENLINRNGDLYFFLTNEEREVIREIKSVEIPSAKETELLGEIIFNEVLKGKTKHKYLPHKNDYYINRICDERFWGKEIKDELGIEIISPLHDFYTSFFPGKCNMHSANRDGFIIVKLDDDKNLISEIRTFLQTEKYIRDKSNAAASNSLKKILSDRADENRFRKERLVATVEKLISEAEFYAMGSRLEIKATTPVKAIEDALNHLIQNTFTKFSYLSCLYDDPLSQLKAVLMADNIAQKQLELDLKTREPDDIREAGTFIDLKTRQNQAILLDELISQFARRPYGWGELQTLVVIAKIYMAERIHLVLGGSRLQPKEALTALGKTTQWRNIKVIKRITISTEELEKAGKLAKELFGSIALEGQDNLGRFIKDQLQKWRKQLETWQTLVDTGRYPGKNEIDHCLSVIQKVAGINDSFEVITTFNNLKDDLLDLSEDFSDLTDFYNHQRKTWEALLDAHDQFKPNRFALEKNPETKSALGRINDILSAPSPYKMLKEVNGLIATVSKVNEQLVKERQENAMGEMDLKISRLSVLLEEKGAKDDFRNKILYPIQQVKKVILTEYSLPQVSEYVNETVELFETALIQIEDEFKPKPPADSGQTKPDQLKPDPKTIKTIRSADCKKKAYLETEKDVDEFVDALKSKLIEAVRNNNKVAVV
jgi:hypothetical protein